MMKIPLADMSGSHTAGPAVLKNRIGISPIDFQAYHLIGDRRRENHNTWPRGNQDGLESSLSPCS